MDPKLKDTLDGIVDIVDDLPEPYNSIAFKEILRTKLTGYSQISDETEVDKDRNNDKFSNTNNSLNKWEKELVENLPEPHIVANSGSRDQQTMWGIITLYGRGVDPTNESIREVIRDELGISPQSISNTSRTLRSLIPQYLHREKKGNGYVYKPNRTSTQLFSDLN